MPAYIITRIHVGDYERWRPMFDRDDPRARENAGAVRVMQGVDDPARVVVFLEFDSIDDAVEARRRLVDSGVLERFADRQGPDVVVEAAV